MKYSPARAQHHWRINRSGTAIRMYLPSPGKFILLLAELHAETQVAAKIPNGKEKPQCRFAYLSQTSAHELTCNALLLGNFPCRTYPSCSQLPSEPRERWSWWRWWSQLTASAGRQMWHACDSATRPKEAPAPLHHSGVHKAEPKGETKGSGKVTAVIS